MFLISNILSINSALINNTNISLLSDTFYSIVYSPEPNPKLIQINLTTKNTFNDEDKPLKITITNFEVETQNLFVIKENFNMKCVNKRTFNKICKVIFDNFLTAIKDKGILLDNFNNHKNEKKVLLRYKKFVKNIIDKKQFNFEQNLIDKMLLSLAYDTHEIIFYLGVRYTDGKKRKNILKKIKKSIKIEFNPDMTHVVNQSKLIKLKSWIAKVASPKIFKKCFSNKQKRNIEYSQVIKSSKNNGNMVDNYFNLLNNKKILVLIAGIVLLFSIYW